MCGHKCLFGSEAIVLITSVVIGFLAEMLMTGGVLTGYVQMLSGHLHGDGKP